MISGISKLCQNCCLFSSADSVLPFYASFVVVRTIVRNVCQTGPLLARCHEQHTLSKLKRESNMLNADICVFLYLCNYIFTRV